MTKMISRLFVMEITLVSSISTEMEANGNDHGYWWWKWGVEMTTTPTGII